MSLFTKTPPFDEANLYNLLPRSLTQDMGSSDAEEGCDRLAGKIYNSHVDKVALSTTLN